MVKARKASGKGVKAPAAAEKSQGGKSSIVAPKKGRGSRKPAPLPAKQEQKEGEEEQPLLELGAQRQRWLSFLKQRSLSTEEAAKLLLDSFCSICVKKQNRHFIVPAARFKLLKGSNNLTTYTFNTHKAKHTFCKTCGVQSFYTPRSNPDGYGVAPHCLDDDGTVHSIDVEQINGKEWEKAMKEHKTIRGMSKS
ncbi:centromere protein V isoform X2 [Microcaecilia unicolor]|uniref:Centromere protein V isoform X2 n=1 Tax=Microcaecilia unicolor TaxID=1415580 RepID=A0A6P7ZFE1_9AMPH|nr:centromere protein V isoform X2 [Microcaecilia unicolor]